MGKICLVCKTKRPPFYKLPFAAAEEVENKWCEFGKVKQWKPGYRLCSIHFEKKFFPPSNWTLKQRRLQKNAVPTIKLSAIESGTEDGVHVVKEIEKETVLPHNVDVDPLSDDADNGSCVGATALPLQCIIKEEPSSDDTPETELWIGYPMQLPDTSIVAPTGQTSRTCQEGSTDGNDKTTMGVNDELVRIKEEPADVTADVETESFCGIPSDETGNDGSLFEVTGNGEVEVKEECLENDPTYENSHRAKALFL